MDSLGAERVKRILKFHILEIIDLKTLKIEVGGLGVSKDFI